MRELGNPKGKKPKEVPQHYEVCEPCKANLDAGEEIPLHLLSKLLKYKFLSIKANDLKRRDTEKKVTIAVNHMGPNSTKPVFGVSDKASFRPVSLATETSYKIEISPVASLHMLLSKKRITKVLIRLPGCPGWSAPVLFANPGRQVFSSGGPYKNLQIQKKALGTS